MADLFQYLAVTVQIINIGLLIGLLSIYLKTYKQIKAPFTIGLLVFVSLILVETLFSITSFVIFTEFRTIPERPPIGPPIGSLWKGNPLVLRHLTQEIFRCIAFAILLKISRE